MADIRETAFDHVAGESIATFYTAERKWINTIHELKGQYPDEVDIRHVNDDGSLVAHIPVSWLKIRPKKKVNMTAEQIAASKARLEKGRMKRLEKNGDDTRSREKGNDMNEEQRDYL